MTNTMIRAGRGPERPPVPPPAPGGGRAPGRWSRLTQRLGSRLAPRFAQRKRASRGSRGAAELSVVVVAGSLVAGVFFGQGLSQTAVDITDGLTWLSDEPTGEIIQVNPATGELQNRQLVGAPGDDLAIAQHDGRLYVTNHTTGQLLAFDLTNILVSGQRRVGTGGAIDLLVHDDHTFLVDSETSTIAAIDPVRTDPIGTIWVAPAGLADAAIDEQGDVWALEDDGTLHRMQWSDEQAEFADDDTTAVDYSGPGSVLVAHERGVTVFGPDQGVVAQAGTDRDLAADAATLTGTLLAPESAPADLVPVAVPDTGRVVILTPDGILEVDMGAIDCAEPATPEVFGGTVYVPCQGQGRIVQLDAEGNRAGSDITTPGSRDPELVIDDDSLIINAPGAPQGVVVQQDGTLSPITRQDGSVPVVTPGSTATPPPPPLTTILDDLLDPPREPRDPDEPREPRDPSTNGPDLPITGPGPVGPPGTGGPGSPAPPTSGAPGTCGKLKLKPCSRPPGVNEPPPTETISPPGTDSISAPSGVTARSLGEGQVEVTWVHAGIPKPDGFVVRSTEGTEFARVKSFVRQAVVSITPGQPTSFTVTAVFAEQESTSAASAPVTATARPDAPTVQSSSSYQGDGTQERFVVVLTWSEAAANGSAVSGYDVSVTTPDGGQSRRVGPDVRSATFEWTCDQAADPACRVGGDYQATVTAVNERGSGSPGVLTAVAPIQPPPPLPASGARVVSNRSPKSVDAGINGQGQITLTLAPPSDWSRFPGQCSYVLNQGAVVPLACNATSVTVAFDNGVIRAPASGTVNHSIVFKAENPRGVSTSQPYTFTSYQEPFVLQPENPCPPNPGPVTCQIP